MTLLRVVPDQLEPESTEPKERFFSVREVRDREAWGNMGWEVWLFEDGVPSNITVRYGGMFHGRTSTKREALAFGERVAKEKGVPFVVKQLPKLDLPLKPTKEDDVVHRRTEMRRRVYHLDWAAVREMGPEYEHGGPVADWSKAAELWKHSADAIEREILAGVTTEQARRGVVSRIVWAISCLERHRAVLLAEGARRGLEPVGQVHRNPPQFIEVPLVPDEDTTDPVEE
jgi:hypothetical protein